MPKRWSLIFIWLSNSDWKNFFFDFWQSDCEEKMFHESKMMIVMSGLLVSVSYSTTKHTTTRSRIESMKFEQKKQKKRNEDNDDRTVEKFSFLKQLTNCVCVNWRNWYIFFKFNYILPSLCVNWEIFSKKFSFRKVISVLAYLISESNILIKQQQVLFQ